MANGNFNEVVQTLMKGMDGFLSTKTVVGEATKIDDTIILPFVDISFGMGAGEYSNDKKNNGAGGLSGKMSPSAVLVIQKNSTRLINIKNQDSMTKILDMVPDLVNKFAVKDDKKGPTDHEAVDIAFDTNE